MIGVRYDYAKLTPKEFNARCSKACLEGDEPVKSSFANWSGFAGINAQVSDTWKLGYQLSTGYRILLLLKCILHLKMLMVHGVLIPL